jgi:hypothetical protein
MLFGGFVPSVVDAAGAVTTGETAAPTGSAGPS